MKLLSIFSLFVALFCAVHSQFLARGTVQLVVNGVPLSSYSSGIVQIYYFTSSSSSNRWGNICYDISTFDSTEASVICHQLGYSGASGYGRAGDAISLYGTDTAATILADVNCGSSSYLTLEQCSFSRIISSSCTSNSEDVYVSCYTSRIWDRPYSGQIRLVGGTYSSYGRLEIYCNEQWGTVCDDSFGYIDARVACRQLGYSDYSTYTGNLAGYSSQPIWLKDVDCSSSSFDCLANCASCPTLEYTCRHSQDVALGCEFESTLTASSNTLSTCRYANFIPESNTRYIIGGVVFGVLILICICCCCCCCCCYYGIKKSDEKPSVTD
ncbi:PREDICTED: deleted in malignant brain tumors 1 protein-like [Amphimedon queenslandica]|uniref:SRCR domain-containing protein n=1 Tax=Amphimedon queenslandica TaxID=400682 RepID=A0AAN0IWN6_AMPQE|nr:PREDICTED: deleted in malignant brain tumors 1 protein-like [Amphimedon queenslandica]|eukprot:XP_019849189.1 PREDICTED: deleted in malignant brain tumors 1 protein-like [Amphimedon queenslandica]